MNGEVMVRENDAGRSIPLKILEHVCKSVNHYSLKKEESYKQAESFLRKIGFKYCDVSYEGSFKCDDCLIDLYSYLDNRIKIYVNGDMVLGCTIKNPPYLFRKHMESSLNGYSILESADSISYERTI